MVEEYITGMKIRVERYHLTTYGPLNWGGKEIGNDNRNLVVG